MVGLDLGTLRFKAIARQRGRSIGALETRRGRNINGLNVLGQRFGGRKVAQPSVRTFAPLRKVDWSRLQAFFSLRVIVLSGRVSVRAAWR